MRGSSGKENAGDILIVDDHPENLELLESILDKEGYRVRAAINGKLALKSIQAKLPDLVLLDIIMPEMDGFATCRKIKENPDTSHIPIIFLSALNEVSDQIRGFEVGGVDFVTKPFEERIILSRIETHVALGQARKQIKNERDLLEVKVQERTKELIEQEKLLRVMAANFPHSYVVIIEKDLTISFCAGQEFKKQNLDPRSIVGLKTDRVFGKHTETVQEHFLKAFQKEERSFELFIDKQWQSYEVVPLSDETGDVPRILAVVENITERKHQEAELARYRDQLEEKVEARTRDLAKSEQKYRDLYDNSPELYFTVDMETKKVIECNATSLKVLGLTRDEFLGQEYLELYHPESRDDANAAFKQLLSTGEVNNAELQVRKKSGEVIDVLLKSVLHEDHQSGQKHSRSVLRDVTDRKRAENDLIRAKEDLEKANKQLKELDQLKSMFIASMSHELRTPLNSIIGFTGLLLQGISGDITELQRDNLNRVFRSGKHLLSLITDVIDISKIEAGRAEVFPERFALKEVVSEAAESIQSEIDKKNMTLTIDALNWTEVYTDRKLLLQCLLNLLSNAVKYSEQGEVAIVIKELPNGIIIDVRDTGIGIAEEDIHLLFEAFERLPTKLKVKAGGTGLGLYLTKKIATTLLRGEITVQSSQKKGSTFSLRIPKELILNDNHEQGS